MAPQNYIDVGAAIKAAEQLLKEKYEAMERVAVVRTDLRNAVTMGSVTEEQRKWIEEKFPLRERKRTKSDTPAVKAA